MNEAIKLNHLCLIHLCKNEKISDFLFYTLTRIIELLSLQCSFLDHVPFDYLFIIRVFVYFKQGLRIHGHKFYVYYQMVFSKFLTFPEKNVPLLITLNFVCRGSI